MLTKLLEMGNYMIKDFEPQQIHGWALCKSMDTTLLTSLTGRLTVIKGRSISIKSILI